MDKRTPGGTEGCLDPLPRSFRFGPRRAIPRPPFQNQAVLHRLFSATEGFRRISFSRVTVQRTEVPQTEYHFRVV